jgi:glutamate-1-semialdehyde 2,1-aminomutase
VAYAKGTPDNVLADVITIPFNNAGAAVGLIREHGSELACMLVDPMPNRAGLAPADKAYLEALRPITREVGALLIFDEVITLRLGHRGAHGLWDIDPDLTTLGKIMGGGFPVGAVAGRKEFMHDAFRQNGVPGGTVGLGSLLKIHFADRPIRDYRSAHLTEQDAQRHAIVSQGLLSRGSGRRLWANGIINADD